MHDAARRGNTEIVKLLATLTDKTNAPNNHGWTLEYPFLLLLHLFSYSRSLIIGTLMTVILAITVSLDLSTAT